MSLARRAIGSRAIGQGPAIAAGPPPTFVVAWADACVDEMVWGSMRKNVAGQFISCQLVSSTDGSAFTGSASVTVTVDNGTQTAGGGTVTHKGGGEHSYALTQAETNGDRVAVKFSGTGAISRTINVYPAFPQTGDTFARIGAPVGASISADIAGVQADTDNIQTRLPTSLVSGRIDASVGAMAANVLTATAIAADAITDAKVASDVTIASVTGSVGSVTGAVGSVTGAVGSVTGNVGGNVVGSVGSVTGNVGGNVVGSVGSVTGAVGSVTGSVGSVASGGITAASIATNAIDADSLATDAVTEIVSAVLTTALTESYNTDGAAPTLTQAVLLALQILSESSVSGTTLTVRRLDGSTTAATFTLNNASTPTSITRAS